MPFLKADAKNQRREAIRDRCNELAPSETM